MAEGRSQSKSWCRSRSREFSEVLRTKLAELRLGDPEGRTNAEALAINLIELGCSQSRNAVAAIDEIIDRTRTEGQTRQSIEIAEVTRDLRERSDQDLQHFLEHDCWPE
jgi:hypothetical protein